MNYKVIKCIRIEKVKFGGFKMAGKTEFMNYAYFDKNIV